MLTESDANSWEAILVSETKKALLGDSDWQHKFETEGCAIHLAVLVEPYLKYVMDGQKTVESRFSANKCAPYRQVRCGDVVLLKKTGGPVVGLCEVAQVWCYELEPTSWSEIKEGFAKALCAQDPEFWKDRQAASFATLMRIENVTPLPLLSCNKRDRRGWVVLSSKERQLSLEIEG